MSERIDSELMPDWKDDYVFDKFLGNFYKIDCSFKTVISDEGHIQCGLRPTKAREFILMPSVDVFNIYTVRLGVGSDIELQEWQLFGGEFSLEMEIPDLGCSVYNHKETSKLKILNCAVDEIEILEEISV